MQKHKRKAEAMVAAQKLDSNFIRKQQLEHEAFGELIARTHVKNVIDRCTATKTKLDMLQGNKDIVIACYWEEEYNKRVNDLLDKLMVEDGVGTSNECTDNVGTDN